MPSRTPSHKEPGGSPGPPPAPPDLTPGPGFRSPTKWCHSAGVLEAVAITLAAVRRRGGFVALRGLRAGGVVVVRAGGSAGPPRSDVMPCLTPRGVWRSRLAAWGGLRPAASIARSGGKFQYAGGDRDGYNGWRQLPLQAPCSIPLGGLRQRRAAVRERLPGDPGWLQKPGLLVRNGLWVTSEGMVRESMVDTPTVFRSRIALSPISPSQVGCIE